VANDAELTCTGKTGKWTDLKKSVDQSDHLPAGQVQDVDYQHRSNIPEETKPLAIDFHRSFMT
jgi:hypothetical protein